MTVVISGTTAMVEQLRKQVDRVIDVVKVMDITSERITVRELVLVKVSATSANRSAVIEIADIFRASIVDVAADSLIIQMTGDEEKIEIILELLSSFGIKEIARTGRIAMLRGGKMSMAMKEEVA